MNERPSAMDQYLVNLSIDYHGPALVDRLSEEQPNIHLPNFLSLKQTGQNREVPRELAFEGKLVNFIAKKADLLFLPGEKPMKLNVPDKQEEDYYSVVPPLETFMGVPTALCRQHLFESLETGDVVVGSVFSVQESGLQILLLCLDCGKAREIDQLKITAICPLREIPKYYAHEHPLDAFTIKDKVRGVIMSVKPELEKIVVSLLSSALPPGMEDIKMGLISDEELPINYQLLQDIDSCALHEDILMSRHSFFNCNNVKYLVGVFGLDNDIAPSLIRKLHGKAVLKGNSAQELRKAQSYRWAFKSVEEGVSHFKAGRHTEAMQNLNMALKIDPDHVEALVARGALYANNGNYVRALEDLEKALSMNPSHSNARKYTCETLLAHARSLTEQSLESMAEKYLERLLTLDPTNELGRQWLNTLRHQNQKVSDVLAAGDAIKLDMKEENPQDKRPMKKTADTLRKLIEEEKQKSRKSRTGKNLLSITCEQSPSSDSNRSRSLSRSSEESAKKRRLRSRSSHREQNNSSCQKRRSRSQSRSTSPSDISSPALGNDVSGKKLYLERDSLSPDSLQYIKYQQIDREQQEKRSEQSNKAKLDSKRFLSDGDEKLAASEYQEIKFFASDRNNINIHDVKVIRENCEYNKSSFDFSIGYWSESDPNIHQRNMERSNLCSKESLHEMDKRGNFEKKRRCSKEFYSRREHPNRRNSNSNISESPGYCRLRTSSQREKRESKRIRSEHFATGSSGSNKDFSPEHLKSSCIRRDGRREKKTSNLRRKNTPFQHRSKDKSESPIPGLKMLVNYPWSPSVTADQGRSKNRKKILVYDNSKGSYERESSTQKRHSICEIQDKTITSSSDSKWHQRIKEEPCKRESRTSSEASKGAKSRSLSRARSNERKNKIIEQEIVRKPTKRNLSSSKEYSSPSSCDEEKEKKGSKYSVETKMKMSRTEDRRISLPAPKLHEKSAQEKRRSVGSVPEKSNNNEDSNNDNTKGSNESLEEMELFLSMLKNKKKEQMEQEKKDVPKSSYKRW